MTRSTPQPCEAEPGDAQQRPGLHTGLWFLAVGGAAALTHYAVFHLASRVIWPEVANPLGFVIAFWVSFWGHRWLSFNDTGTTVGQSLRRFAITSLSGFATNEVIFVACYRGLDWPAWLSWFIAAAMAAGQTFVLGRFWAFRR